MVRITDHTDMTSAVYCGHKALNQTINTGVTRYYSPCFNEDMSHVLIRDVLAVNAQLLFMRVTRRHAKIVLNYEYLT